MNHKVYGEALFLAATEGNAIEAVYKDLSCVYDALSSFPEYSKLLDTPMLSRDEKHRIINDAFGALHPLAVNLIKLMSDKGIFFAFRRACESYGKLYDGHFNIVRAEATTARPISEEQTAKLCEKLERMTSKRVILKNTVDPGVLGGIRITYEGVQLDNTILRRLCDIEKRLKNTII